MTIFSFFGGGGEEERGTETERENEREIHNLINSNSDRGFYAAQYIEMKRRSSFSVSGFSVDMINVRDVSRLACFWNCFQSETFVAKIR